MSTLRHPLRFGCGKGVQETLEGFRALVPKDERVDGYLNIAARRSGRGQRVNSFQPQGREELGIRFFGRLRDLLAQQHFDSPSEMTKRVRKEELVI